LINDSELVFIYLGTDFPKYANHSLDLASFHSGIKVHLIGSHVLEPKIKSRSVKFTAVEDFYDGVPFKAAAEKVWGNHGFRDGFWLKSMERLFVLEQYMKTASTVQILHAELDQIVFKLDALLDNLNQIDKRGIFIPFHTSRSAVASILYCNKVLALSSLLDFARGGDVVPNEMALLANWARENPESIHPMPTLASQLNRSAQADFLIEHTLDAGQTGGVVDAAQLGQWVGGIDPRNVPIRLQPMNKFVDEPVEALLTREQLNGLRFELTRDGSELSVHVDASRRYRVYNLHIHSKIHDYLNRTPAKIHTFFSEVNLERQQHFPGSRKVQITDFLKSRVQYLKKNPWRISSEIQARTLSLFKCRPSSIPFVSGDTFRALADAVWEQNNKHLRVEDIRPGSIIFCESELLPELKSRILNKVTVPFALILGNSDFNHGDELENLIARTSVTTVWAQNLTCEVNRVKPIPIGLENAWRSNHGIISRFKGSVAEDRVWRIFAAFNIGTNLNARSIAANVAVRASNTDRLTQLSPAQHCESLKKYAFVLSPEGNGLDTHRTWEAMYVGCVPIVSRSFMSDAFVELGLPLWVVDSYDEILDYNEKALQTKYFEIVDGSLRERLYFKYWRDQITQPSKPIC
jgi:hypothetical protein